MCGRYYISSEEDVAEMNRIIEEIDKKLGGSPEHFGIGGALKKEVFPTDIVPVISKSKSRNTKPFLMKWGYTRQGGSVIINARSESVFEKPLFYDGIISRRCLIPATCYFEWKKRGGKRVKYAIRPEGSRIMYMAGIYRLMPDSEIPQFVILTRPACKSILFIHDRMPVILPPGIHEQWLAGEGDIRRMLAEEYEPLEYKAV